MVARINGVQTIHQLLSRHDMIRPTRSRADNVDSNTTFLYDLVRESSGETDNSTLGGGVVEELSSAYANWDCLYFLWIYLRVSYEWVLTVSIARIIRKKLTIEALFVSHVRLNVW
jgi:hypothetical protein